MIVVTEFFSILKQIEFHLVESRNKPYEIPFGSKSKAPYEIPFGSKSKEAIWNFIWFKIERKTVPRSYSIHFERKWRSIFQSVNENFHYNYSVAIFRSSSFINIRFIQQVCIFVYLYLREEKNARIKGTICERHHFLK